MDPRPNEICLEPCRRPARVVRTRRKDLLARPRGSAAATGEPLGHLLQILDETYRGYQDSRWVLDAAAVRRGAREPSTGMALVDAQLLAAMRRTVTPERVVFELAPYRDLGPRELTGLRRAAERYGEFLHRVSTVELL